MLHERFQNCSLLFIRKNFFNLECNAFKKLDSRLAVVNVSAADKHVDCLHSLVYEDVDFGIKAEHAL